MKRLLFLFILPYLLISCSKEEITTKVKEENPLYDKAFDYREINKNDSAFYYFNLAKDYFLLKKDSLGAGKCLVNMAIISEKRGDYLGSLELSLNANDYFNTSIDEHQPYIRSNYNCLGLVAERLGNYKDAIDYYHQSIKYTTDSTALTVVKNNLANSYRRLGNYPIAIKIYEDLLKQKPIASEYARILSNLAYTKLLKDPNYKALPFLLEALNIREKQNIAADKNASYSHLAEYYKSINPDSAFYYAKKMYTVALAQNSTDDQLQALQKLIKLSPSALTKQYFDTYQNLEAITQIAKNKDKNQFALIRYNTEKHKADNLILHKENTEKKYEVIKRDAIIFSLLFIFVSAAIAIILWYKKRKERLELAAQNQIRENQLKTSKKVHDVVANGLYRVMTEIENRRGIDKEGILDSIDDLYQKSRDISYEVEIPKENSPIFSQKIAMLLNSFNSTTTSVIAIGNTKELWENTSEQVGYEVEHILQELMVNMKKHSQANEVEIKFEDKGEYINITYTDNGIGMASHKNFKNGLTNTGNRINIINGTINFDSKNSEGLMIYLSFPKT